MTFGTPNVEMTNNEFQIQVEHVPTGLTVSFPQGVTIGTVGSDSQTDINTAFQGLVDLFDASADWSIIGTPVKIGFASQEVTPTP